MKVLEANGWLDNDRRMVIMDADYDKDIVLEVDNSNNITKNIVGEHLYDFDSCLVLAHFKGHAMGGFGGALKQLIPELESLIFIQEDLQVIIMKPGITELSNWTSLQQWQMLLQQ